MTLLLFMFCAQIDDLSLSSILFLADEKRETFIKAILQETKKKHFVRRPYIYEDVIKLYSDKKFASEHPLYISFEGEHAVDFGGVSRDMLSGFCEQAYKKLFDGCTLLTPVMHPQVDMPNPRTYRVSWLPCLWISPHSNCFTNSGLPNSGSTHCGPRQHYVGYIYRQPQ